MTSRVYVRNFDDPRQIEAEMNRIGVDIGGVDVMVPKGRFFTFILRDIDPRAANIIKQEFLSKGGEAALAYHCLSDLDKCSDMLLMATEKQYNIIISKFQKQPFGLKDIAVQLETAMANLDCPRDFSISCGNKIFKIGGHTWIMGVLNVTPDSFSDGGKFSNVEEAVAHGMRMAEEGADIIDIGGESTRPGSASISVDEELGRVIPVIEELVKITEIPISIDTSKPEVAEAGIDAGASMINDITGLADERMMKLAAERDVPVVIMHMSGTPTDMQKDPNYDDVVYDIIDIFMERVARAVEQGVSRNNIIIDPGIGFGKTLDHNLQILKRLSEFKILGLPILVGASRKSFIGKLQGTDEDERLEGSVAAAIISAMNGADIVRVHDVKETKMALLVGDAIGSSGNL